MKRLLRNLLLGVFLITLSPNLQADEFGDSTFIRDAEIESILKSYVGPIFKVAGLNPELINIHMVADKRLNAMATIGYQFILFTGFLLRADNVDQVVGVLAHESAHIADGHVARIFGQVHKMNVLTIAHVLMGVAAAVAGSPEAGLAIGLGGMGMAQNNFLHYHRGQEAAADHDGMRFLDRLGWSSKGLGEFLDILRRQEYFSSSRQDPYLRTHPLTQDRVAAVKGHLEKSKHSRTPFPQEFIHSFKIMQAKLRAYLYPSEALGKYPESDTSIYGKYARAIAYYRQQDLNRAFPLIEDLLKQKPKNAYFWELKGQVLFENGRTKEAITAYSKAIQLAPKADLLKVQYAQVLVEMNDPQYLPKAESLLKQAHVREKQNSMLWRMLAVVYGRKEKVGLMSLALAEEAHLKGDEKRATYQANRAILKLPKNSGPWLRAKDLLGKLKQENA